MHDALWHISLAKLGFESWPLSNPFMAGAKLSGYNFLLDYIIHILFKIGISPFFTFFKLLPIIASTTYIFSVLSYLKSQKMTEQKSNFYAFFLYFASSFSYLATLYSAHTLSGSTLRGFPVVSAITPSTMFLNLQFAFSLSLILWILIRIKRKPCFSNSMVLGGLFFALFGFKFYGAVVALIIYALSNIFTYSSKWLTKSKVIEVISISFFSYLGLYIFYGVSKTTSIPFVFAPFALPRLLIDDPLLFYNHNLTLARYYLYENSLRISPRLIAIESLSVFLFMIFNFGTRILAILYLLISAIKKNLSVDHLVFTIIIFFSFAIPIFFIQAGGWYNTMQFLYYGLWLASFLAAQCCSQIYSSRFKSKYVMLVIIFILTIPNIIDQLRYISAPQITIDHNELMALEELKKAPPGVVHINNPVHRNGYIPALAEKIPYYLDTDQLMVTHSPYQKRLEYINKYQGGSITSVPADYFYIYKTEWGTKDAIMALSNSNYKVLYDSSEIIIYAKITVSN